MIAAAHHTGAIGQPSAYRAKLIGTAKARAALIGAVVHDSHDDRGRPTWILSRWSLTKEFGDIADLNRVLDVMGAPA